MPIRLTCPSCSATLSVKDEFAGRAVKCPKCGGVIPASDSGAAVPPPPPPPPEPAPPAERSSVEEFDEPARPAKSGGKITGRPVARAMNAAAEDEEERPRRRRDEEEDDDRPRRRRDEEDDDRPTRRKRRDDDDEPRGRRGKPEGGKSNTPVILAIVGFFLLTCCGGVGFGGYWLYTKAKKAKDQFVENIENTNFRVNQAGYAQLNVGVTSRERAEQILGGGKIATAADIEKSCANDAAATDKWMAMVAKNRAVIWRNGDDYILAAFHPNTDGKARLQMKEWRPKTGLSLFAGETSDTVFLEKHPPGKTPGETPGTPGGGADEEPPPGALTEVSAEDLARAYKDNEAAADATYKGKWLLVKGKVKHMQPDGKKNTAGVELDGVKRGKFDLLVWCFGRPDETSKMLNLAVGQTATFEGKCLGTPAKTFVHLEHCRVKSTGPDPAIKTTAADLVREFADDEKAANEKYKDKEVLVSDAVVLAANRGNTLVRFRAPPGGPPITLQANFLFDQNDKIGKLKPGDKVKFRARAGLLFGAAPNRYVSFYDAYFVP